MQYNNLERPASYQETAGGRYPFVDHFVESRDPIPMNLGSITEFAAARYA